MRSPIAIMRKSGIVDVFLKRRDGRIAGV